MLKKNIKFIAEAIMLEQKIYFDQQKSLFNEFNLGMKRNSKSVLSQSVNGS